VTNRVRVLIADDHPSVRENLRYLVDAEGDMECVGVAKDGLRCVDLCHEVAPQVLVLDGDLPDIQIVMYTIESEICEVARWQGAFACVLKDAPYEMLIDAVRRAGYAPVGSETF